MQIDRDTAAEHLRRGWPVLHNGRQLEPTALANGTFAAPRELPPEEAGGEYVAMRHDDGTHTRAGMSAILARGEGIMLGTRVITSEAELPPAEVLAAGDVRRLEQIAKQQDETFAKLRAEREATERELERAHEQAKARERETAKAARQAAKGQGQQPPADGGAPRLDAPPLGGTPNPEAPGSAGKRHE